MILNLLTNKVSAVCFCVVLLALTVQAQTLRIVTKTEDTNDGACDADCSLREAISAANTNDMIAFASPLFDSPQTITLSEAAGFRDLIINKTLTIDGKGANLLTVRRDPAATANFRVFTINSPAGTVTLGRMTISGGKVFANIGGGGVYSSSNQTTLFIDRCHVTGNTATTSSAGGAGGVASIGNLIIRNSTISNNAFTVNTNSPSGGGVFFSGSGGATFEMSDSTVSGNTVGGASDTNGGGIYLAGVNHLISNSTVTDNGANGANSASGVYGNQNTTLRSTIVAGNRSNQTFPDFVGATNSVVSLGFNLIGNVGAAIGFNSTNDLKGASAAPINPLLQPLADNGGGTPTHALIVGSPAIDSGNRFGSLTDQRGVTRPFDNPNAPPASGGDNTDIGAFEAGSFAPLVVTKIEDTNDGACDADCSLREAIAAAGARGSEITFSSLFDQPQTITLSDAANFRALSVNKSLTINGKGANLLTIRRDSASTFNFNIFSIANSSIGIAVKLSGLSITGGRATSVAPEIGGGIEFKSVNGSLTVSNSYIYGNSAVGQSSFKAGGIFAKGTLIVRNSTIANNTATAFSGAVDNSGGGICLLGATNAELQLFSSTVSGNVVSGEIAGSSNAGGIYLEDFASSGNRFIRNSTIADNSATGANSASGIIGNSKTFFRSTIVAANRSNTSVPDVSSNNGAFVTQGYNLIGSAPANIGFDSQIYDQYGTLTAPLNPRLYALANNGGTTPTHRLQSNSPAIDAGFSFGGITVDQRGLTCPVDIPAIANGGGDLADIGAFELQNTGYLPPAAFEDSYITTRNTTLTVNAPGVLANDTSFNGGTLTAIKVSNPTNGSVTLRPDGGFTYTPNPNNSLGDSFTYKVNDGTDNSGVVTVQLNNDGRGTSSYTVTKVEDTNDGACDADCSLREAVAATADGGTISFVSPLFDVPQTIALTDNLQTLNINKNLIVNGRGANLLTISRGEVSSTSFRILNASGSGVTVNLNNLTIDGGDADTNNGGGINAVGGVTLNVSGCAVTGGSARLGGGIYVSADSRLTLTGSTISGNTASGNVSGGGGIHNEGTLTIVNSTVSGNAKIGGTNNGGGVWSNLTANVKNSTVTSNQADGANSAGGLYKNGGTFNVGSSIVAANRSNNSVPDVSPSNGAFFSDGYNLIGSANAGNVFSNGSQFDQIGTLASPLNPKLRMLVNNGGTIKTHALGVNSPALDKGRAFGLTSDQRGFQRTIDFPSIPNPSGGGGTDTGAFEAQAAPTNTAPVPSASPNPIIVEENTPGFASIAADDADGDNITFSITSQPAHGSIAPGEPECEVRNNSSRCVINGTYTPNQNFYGADSFSFKANDGQVDSAIYTVNIIVNQATHTVVVTKTSDTNDGVCNADCSLREAIAAAKPGDSIEFASPLFDSPQTITLNTGLRDLVINKSLTINGKGASLLKVHRNNADPHPSPEQSFRIFNVNGSGVNVNLNGMTISGGQPISFPPYYGGGINNNGGGTLTLTACHITDNKTTQGGAGGIYNDSGSTLNLVNSTVSKNLAAGNLSTGGGIDNRGTMFIVNSTVSGNQKLDYVNNTDGNGGGIYNAGTLTISNSTITDNRTVGGTSASGIYNTNVVSIGNSIVAAGRNNADVGGSQFTSNGYNLIGNRGTVTGFNQTGDQTGTSAAILDPRLGLLGDYGGATPTHRLQTSPVISPAIDAGNSFGTATDQRGLLRPVDLPSIANASGGDTADIGAFETQSSPPSTVSISGTVTYGNTPSGQTAKPVPDVILSSIAGPSVSDQSNSTGAYSIGISTTGVDYTIAASKIEDASGITAFDATLVLRCVASGNACSLTANQKKAGDTDNDGAITAFDATQILRYVAANGSSANTGNAGKWKFDPEQFIYQNLNSSQPNQNYVAFLIGDVDGDWAP